MTILLNIFFVNKIYYVDKLGVIKNRKRIQIIYFSSVFRQSKIIDPSLLLDRGITYNA